ncbi:hypothetical protein HDV00_012777 [Rhizophlyctis rosea]|nr:hypothetical protein HDV00_012777 [Rhizophlyctis rosea]
MEILIAIIILLAFLYITAQPPMEQFTSEGIDRLETAKVLINSFYGCNDSYFQFYVFASRNIGNKDLLGLNMFTKLKQLSEQGHLNLDNVMALLISF